jgi:predicted short-subunit dehydrogenase-like oxidoreductase (DUF2520 family)
LARLWQQQGSVHVQDVLTTSLASAHTAVQFIGAGAAVPTLSAMRSADVWMVAVPDARIESVAQALADTQQRSDAVVFHCSGAHSAALLQPLAALGWHTASAHCILSFAKPQAALEQFKGTVCALEGSAAACAVLRQQFATIGAQCFEVATQDKLLYHAAAVFATNFLPVLQSVAEDAWRSAGVPPQLIAGLRASLLANAVANITQWGPAGALTGPAARGDRDAIARQSAKVQAWDPLAGAAYDALSALALRLAAQRALGA